MSNLIKTSKPINISISYAHADASHKDRLLSTLATLKGKKLVEAWTDRQIDGGNDWRDDIDQAMDACQIALLLVSPAFLASEFIQTVEMRRLMERRESDGIRVVPIIIRPCMWEFDDIGALQAWPKNGQAVITFSDDTGARDQVWLEIGRNIAGLAKAFLAQPTLADDADAFAETGADLPPDSDAAANPCNPFNPWQPALAPRFYGRDELLRNLASALDQRRSVSLIGDWRMGKTSLLLHWQMQAEANGRVVRMLSGEAPEAVSCASFVRVIIGQGAGHDGALDEPEHAADVLGNWARTLVPAGLPPLILIDEADGMLARLPHRFFERLRGLLNSQTLCLVLATRQTVDLIYQGAGGTSPFVNILEMRRVGLLEPDGAAWLIALGGITFGDEERALLRRWAGRHPYHLALLGRRLWEARQRGGAADDALVAYYDEAQVRLRELWKTLGEKEKANIFRVRDGQAIDRMASGAMALRGLLDTRGGKVEVFGEVLATWLRDQR